MECQVKSLINDSSDVVSSLLLVPGEIFRIGSLLRFPTESRGLTVKNDTLERPLQILCHNQSLSMATKGPGARGCILSSCSSYAQYK